MKKGDVKEYYKQVCVNKLDNLSKTEKIQKDRKWHPTSDLVERNVIIGMVWLV